MRTGQAPEPARSGPMPVVSPPDSTGPFATGSLATTPQRPVSQPPPVPPPQAQPAPVAAADGADGGLGGDDKPKGFWGSLFRRKK